MNKVELKRILESSGLIFLMESDILWNVVLH